MADGYGCKAAGSFMQADGPAAVKLGEPCCLDLVAGMWEVAMGCRARMARRLYENHRDFYENGGAQET